MKWGSSQNHPKYKEESAKIHHFKKEKNTKLEGLLTKWAESKQKKKNFDNHSEKNSGGKGR